MLVVIALGTAACVVDEAPPPDTTTTTTPGDTSIPKLAANGLPSAALQANLSSVNKLASAALVASNPGVTSLLATTDGQTVLTYLVQCALPASASVTYTSGSGAQKYTGQLGLAPDWQTTTPTASERRWVSACVLARTNYYGLTVSLSLRGSNPALSSSLLEPVTYLYAEAAFWGDLFAPGAPTQYSCDALVKTTGLSLSTMALRDCSIPQAGSTTTTMCGFSFIGHCGVLDLSLEPACKSLTAPYANCHTSQAANSPTIAEVITVYLQTL
jgi:hypothetical protein